MPQHAHLNAQPSVNTVAIEICGVPLEVVATIDWTNRDRSYHDGKPYVEEIHSIKPVNALDWMDFQSLITSGFSEEDIEEFILAAARGKS